MKRISFLVFLLLITLIFTACSSSEVNGKTNTTEKSTEVIGPTYTFDSSVKEFPKTEKELEPYFEMAKKQVEIYALAGKSQDLEFPEFTLPLTEDARKYLELRFESEMQPLKKSGFRENYSNGEYELLDWDIIDNVLYCQVKVSVKFNYSDATQLSSGEGYGIQLLIENPGNPTIADWYNGDPGSFDSQVRSCFLDLADKENWLSNQNIDEILAKGQKLLES